MLEEGYITADEVKTAMSQSPTKAKRYWSGAGQYVADMVRDDVTALIGQVTEDIVVETTIDMTLEKKAEAALTESLAAEGAKVNASQAALVSIDGTGAIRLWSAGVTMPKASSIARSRRSDSLVRPSNPSSMPPRWRSACDRAPPATMLRSASDRGRLRTMTRSIAVR